MWPVISSLSLCLSTLQCSHCVDVLLFSPTLLTALVTPRSCHGVKKKHERGREAVLVNPLRESVAREVWTAGVARSNLNRVYRPMSVGRGFCLSRCTWTPRTSPNATASSSSPHKCCLQGRGTWRVQFANHRCRDCGCGWCTLLPLYRFVLWSCVSLASGKTQRPDRRLCRVFSGVGFFPTWFSKQHPCFACNLTLQDIADNKTDGWVGRTVDDDTNCCASCEVAAHQDILLLLT